MNDERPAKPDIDGALLPNGSADSEPRADQIAGQQFMHGLLAHLHHDDDETQRRHVAAVMSAIERVSPARPRRHVRRSIVCRAPRWPVASRLAAAIIVIITVLVVTPSDRTALAVVRSSIDAAAQASDRRYEVRMLGEDADETGRPNGRVDLRGSDHVVVEFETPFGHRVVVGRRGSDTWAIRHDGVIDRFPPEHTWPRWITFGQNTFLIDSVDALVTTLPDAYEMRLERPAPLPQGGERRFERISAVHQQRASAEPRRVELWINTDSGLVERMELHWPQSFGFRGGLGGDQAPGGPRPGHRPRGGPPPRDGFGDRPPRRDGFEDRPPREGGFGGPPPRGPRRDGAGPPDGPGAEGGPPRRRPRPRGDVPPGHRRGQGPAPEYIDGRPDFHGGHHPPPPKTIVFQRVDVQPLDDAWFTPEAHVR